MDRVYVAVAATAGLFVAVQLGALALVDPFVDAGFQMVEDPTDPSNSLVYVGAILVATAAMLGAMKYGVDRLLQGVIIFAAVFISFYVFTVVVPPAITVAGVNVLAVLAALGLGAGLLLYPEWYVIDAAGVVMGAGAAGLFGISIGLLPAIVLLLVLAVYDAVSVYGTEHMLALASGAMDLRLPVVLVVPLTLSYSFLDEEGPESLEGESASSDGGRAVTDDPDETGEIGDSDDETGEIGDSDDAGGETHGAIDPDGGTGDAVENRETQGDPSDPETPDDPVSRDAFFIGLGDAVIPTILIASAAFFRPGDVPLLDVPGIALTVPALGAMVGTIAGLLVLMSMVMRGRAHAGLPLLNGGAIAGYLVGATIAGVSIVEAIGVAPYL